MSLSKWKTKIVSLVARPMDRMTKGLDNQSQLLDMKFEEVIQGIKNQSDLLNRKLGSVVQGVDNQSKLLDSRFERLILGIENLSQLFNSKSEQLIRSQSLSEQAIQRTLDPVARKHLNVSLSPSVATPSSASGRLNSEQPYQSPAMNDLGAYANVFAGITPWSGTVPEGYLVDFLGTLTSADFRVMFGVDPKSVGGRHETTRLPTIADGEGWFESVNWVIAAQEARGRYVMVTLGACYGAQAVGSYRALQLLNAIPCKFVAVEPDPENYEWTVRHFRDNGLDPNYHWLVQAAISDTNAPVFFPVGSPGTGAQNCFASNEIAAREVYVDELIKRGPAEALRNLLLHNTTGITKSLVEGHDFSAEIKVLSAVTLRDILGPFEVVDYLESDIQQSEILVFPPYMALLKDKVRRIHIGTHGREVHSSLHNLFQNEGWEIVFSFEPNAEHASALGTFKTNDGVLTVRNKTL